MFRTEVLSHNKISLKIDGPIRTEDVDRLIKTFDGLIESDYQCIRISLNHITNMDIEFLGKIIFYQLKLNDKGGNGI